MTPKQAVGWLLLVLGSAQARDPFVPPTVLPCLQDIPSQTRWRLQGMIGREGHFYAWLLSPQGRSVRVVPGQPFPLPDWQVDKLQAFSITLSTAQRCQPGVLHLKMKGMRDDKDHHDLITGAAGASGTRE